MGLVHHTLEAIAFAAMVAAFALGFPIIGHAAYAAAPNPEIETALLHLAQSFSVACLSVLVIYIIWRIAK